MRKILKTVVEIEVEIECDITPPSKPPPCYNHDDPDFSDCGDNGSFEIESITCCGIILDEKIKKQIEEKFYNSLFDEALDNFDFENDKQDAMREDFFRE